VQNLPAAHKNAAAKKNAFLERLVRFQKLWQTWHNGLAGGANDAKLPVEKSHLLNFVQETTSPTFAYALLDAMMRRSNVSPSDHLTGVLVKRFGPVTDPAGLGYVFRYEHARSLYLAGKGAEAVKELRSLHADALRHGVLPPIDRTFREILDMPVENGLKFTDSVLQARDGLLKENRFRLALQLARQVAKLGDAPLADEILAAVLARSPEAERGLLLVESASIKQEFGNDARAEQLLQQALQDRKVADRADLWRWRSELARKVGRPAAA
jgi:hypothetical protein